MDSDRTRTRPTIGQRRRRLVATLRAVWPRSLSWSLAWDDCGGKPITLGRTPDADAAAPLVHDTVSRRHLRVEWDPDAGRHMAVDLGSHNGTRVDGVPLSVDQRAPLGDGAVLQVGDVVVVYERDEAGRRRGGGRRVREADISRDAVPGDSATMTRLRAALGRVAPDPSPALLLGETGTGKEWIAREIHRASGRTGPLVTINCSALSAQLIDSQLFGHVRGAFTGATADSPGLFRAAAGGSLFLDEIGDLPLSLQPKLLRALQEREVQPVGSARAVAVDVRVIAATHHDLAAHVEEGAFRRDLYARLALWELRIPPLRERRTDVIGWLDRLHARWLEQRGGAAGPRGALELTADAAAALVGHAWPDNLRGLDRLVHALAVRPVEGAISIADLPGWLTRPASPRPSPPAEPGAAAGPEPRARASRPPVPTAEEFAAVFEELGGNVRAIARRFQRDRRQIYRWIDAHGLSATRTPGEPE